MIIKKLSPASSPDQSFANTTCNSWFKIKLSVKNDCSNWDTEERLFRIQCPDVEHLDSEFCCPSFSCSNLALGSSGLSGYSYIWGPELNRNCLSSYTIPNPVFNSSCLNIIPSTGYPLTYTVRITDNYGCSDDKKVFIYGNAPTGSIETQVVCFGVKLKSIHGSIRNHNFSWYINSVTSENFISNDEEIEVSPNTATTYYLKLSNACGDVTNSVNISLQSVKKGDIDTLTFNNSIHSDLDFVVSYINATNPNSKYNATNWAIYFLGRWGHSDWANPSEPIVRGYDCNGFENGTIKWDCKVNGTRLQPGVYHIRLVLTNCDKVNNTKYLDVSCTTKPYILKNWKYDCRGRNALTWINFRYHKPHNGLEKCNCYSSSKTDLCNKVDFSTKFTHILPIKQCICKEHKVAAACLIPNMETTSTCIQLYVE